MNTSVDTVDVLSVLSVTRGQRVRDICANFTGYSEAHILKILEEKVKDRTAEMYSYQGEAFFVTAFVPHALVQGFWYNQA